MLFINLTVADVNKATSFYEAIGATKEPIWSNESTHCIKLMENTFVMLHTAEAIKQWVPKEKVVADSHKVTEVINCYTVDNRNEVDDIVGKAARAGGKADPNKLPEMPGMYGRSFEDPDGHIWELCWMDMAAMASCPQGGGSA